jgi:aryl-alcohol dehydrogenase-like predicted oxidoreductase
MFGDTDFEPSRAFSYTPFEKQLEAIAAALQTGKIRRWGISNETPWGVAKWASTARLMSVPGPAVVQNAYNILCRTADGGLVEACVEEGVQLLAYSPLAMGLLTGKYTATVQHSVPVPAGPQRGRDAELDYGNSTLEGAGSNTESMEEKSLHWSGPEGSRLVRYRHLYTEAESRFAPAWLPYAWHHWNCHLHIIVTWMYHSF